MSMFIAISCHLLFDHFQFALIHGPNIPGSYATLFFTASDLTSITSHIHNWVLFSLWLHLFILSGVISPLISSSILGTYWSGEFIFQCPIFLPFHTVHGVFKARIVKWFAIPFSSTPCFISVQFSSVAQSCPTLCDPMNLSTPGLPVHHQLPELTQTHVHRVSDAIQPCHPLSSPSPPAPNPSQHQSLFQRVNSFHEVAKVLEFQL